MGIGSNYAKINRLSSLTIDNTLTVSGSDVLTSLPDGTLTLENIGELDYTTLDTVLSAITQETQHHIGSLIVADMSYAKTLYLPSDATDSSAKSMRHYHTWFDFEILTLTGTTAQAVATFDATGYASYENNFTVEDTVPIVGSTDNDGTYSMWANATRDGDIVTCYPENLTSLTVDGSFLKMHNGTYTVPAGKVFLVGGVSYYLDHGYNRGRIGEGTALNGQITRDVLCFGTGTIGGGNDSVPGVFTAGKYVNAESTTNYSLRVPTLVYGVEVSTTPEITTQFDIGGYICEDYNELKTLICFDDPTSSARKTFHYWDGDSWENYQVPTGKVYIAGAISYWTDYATNKGIIGESDAVDSTITKQLFMCGNANINSGFQEVYGRFTAGKYVTAQTSSGFSLRKPTYIYGVEIDA